MDDAFSRKLAERHERIVQDVRHQSTVEPAASPEETFDDEFESCLECLELIDRVRRRRELRSAFLHSGETIAADTLSLPKQLGRFRIEREIGRGGAGVVLLAVDSKLGRKVAIKVPHPQYLCNDSLRRRFRREAEAMARLNHSHILPVHEVGEEGPIAFLATEYCDGPTLRGWLTEQAEPVAAEVAARIVRDLALAVHHAHGHSIIHRDIKPSNVLVMGTTIEGKRTVPNVKICDFGLAKVLDEQVEFSQTGDLLGTPSYMAPEQAEGKLREIDAQTDVYALGAVLFEILTGRPPFEGESRSAILLKVVQVDPPDVRSLRADVPRDLAVIVSRCLAKPKRERYRTAGELAADLDRYIHGLPIHARSTSWWERLGKWVRRRPAAAVAAALGILFPLTVLGVSIWANVTLFEKNREIMSRLYAADMRSAKRAVDDYRYDEARGILAKYEPQLGSPDVRTLAWDWLASQIPDRSTIVWKCHDADVYSVDVSPDETHFLTSSRDGTACLWRMEDGSRVRRFAGHDGEVNQALFVPGGIRMVTAGNDGTVRVWEIATGECLRVIEAHALEITGLAVAPDGRRGVSGSLDGRVREWDLETGAEIGEAFIPGGKVDALAVVPDGSSIAISAKEVPLVFVRSGTHEVVWQLNQGAELAEGTRARSLIYESNGARLLLGQRYTAAIDCVELASRTATRLKLAPRSGITSQWILPQSNTLVYSDESGQLVMQAIDSDGSGTRVHSGRSRIWDSRLVADGTAILLAHADGRVARVTLPRLGPSGVRTLLDFEEAPSDMLVSKDGRTLFLSGDRTLATADCNTGDLIKIQRAIPAQLVTMELSPDESILATGDDEGGLYLWDAKSLDLLAEGPRIEIPETAQRKWVLSIQFFPDKPWLIFGVGYGATLVIWDFEMKSIVWEATVGRGDCRGLEILKNGRLVAAFERLLVCFEWKDDGYRELWRQDFDDFVNEAFVLPSEESILVQGNRGRLNWHDPETGSEQYSMRLARSNPFVFGFALSPSGRRLATGSNSGVFAVWDAERRIARSVGLLDEKVLSVAFSPDESTVYAGLRSGRIVARSVEYENPSEFVDPGREVLYLTASFDGRYLALHSRNEDREVSPVEILETNPCRPVSEKIGGSFDVASFSPDDSHCVFARKNRCFRVPLANLNAEPEFLFELENDVTDLQHVSEEDVLCKDSDNVVRLVHLGSGQTERVIWDSQTDVAERMAVDVTTGQFAIGTVGHKIHIWRLGGEEVRSVETPGLVRSLCFTPDGRQLAVGSDFGTIDVLQLERLSWDEAMYCDLNYAVQALAFADEGRTLLSSTVDGVTLWNMETREVVYTVDSDIEVRSIVVRQQAGFFATSGTREEYSVVRIHRLPAR